MGFTLKYNTGTSTARALPTPEQEAIAAANHNHMKRLEAKPPITVGSEKQINWAKAIASQFLFHAHAWGFKADEIDSLFANRGKYAKFWIDNRNPSGNSGEGVTRVAVEKELAQLKQDSTINNAMAARSHDQFRVKVCRL